jgi:hypothetical protein
LVYVSHLEEQPKYGIFYHLSNGMVGMRFNDQTVLSSDSRLTLFRYSTLQHNR